jgi:hypothetical protein
VSLPGVRVVYIAGEGHSGSTLLDALLNAHPEIVGLGEAHRLSLEPWQRVCGDGHTIMSSPFWRPLIEQVCRRREVSIDDWPSSLPTTRLDTGSSKRVRDAFLAIARPRMVGLGNTIPVVSAYFDAVRNSLDFFAAAAEQARSAWVVDSSKSPARMKALSLVRPSCLRVIHLVRDPRAVAASAARREGVDAHFSARRWLRENAKVRWLLWGTSTPRILIRYEDLTANVESTLKRIWHFLGVEEPPLGLDLSTERHEIPGNSWLVQHTSGDLVIQSDERWIKELGAAERSVVERTARRAMFRYGYSQELPS